MKTITSVGLVLVCSLAGCRREDRTFRPSPAATETVRWTSLGDLRPGPDVPPVGGSVDMGGPTNNEYEENAYAIAQGRRLYSAFNCVGCHGHGGGGMGPALMDDSWIYGSQPRQVFSTIVEGRPNGMPTFGPRIPAYQIWWLVAYVRSLSGLADPNAAPARPDHMEGNPPPSTKKPEKPVDSALPKSAELPK